MLTLDTPLIAGSVAATPSSVQLAGIAYHPEFDLPVSVTLTVTGTNVCAASHVGIAVAALSCGYWVTAKAYVPVDSAGFTANLANGLVGQQSQVVFAYLDVDGDGVCDTSKGDTVWTTQVDGRAPASITLDWTQLTQTDGWECSLFQDY